MSERRTYIHCVIDGEDVRGWFDDEDLAGIRARQTKALAGPPEDKMRRPAANKAAPPAEPEAPPAPPADPAAEDPRD